MVTYLCLPSLYHIAKTYFFIIEVFIIVMMTIKYKNVQHHAHKFLLTNVSSNCFLLLKAKITTSKYRIMANCQKRRFVDKRFPSMHITLSKSVL